MFEVAVALVRSRSFVVWSAVLLSVAYLLATAWRSPPLTLALAGGGCLTTWQGDRL